MWPFKRRRREPDPPQAEAVSIAAPPASDDPPARDWTKLEMCPDGGAGNPHNGEKCVRCGAGLAEDAVRQEQTPQSPPRRRVRGRRTFTFQLAGLESELVFRRTSSPLATDEIQGFRAPQGASGYLVFADEEHNIGGAYFCTDPQSGRVYRVDPENSTSFELVNTTMDAFQASMAAAAQWSAQHSTEEMGEHPESVDELASRLSAIDPAAFSLPDSLWPGLVDQIREGAKETDDEMELWFRTT